MICIICNKEFEKKHNNQKCCDKDCSIINNKKVHSTYYKEWRIKNKEKIKNDNKEYYDKNEDLIKYNKKKYYLKNKDKIEEYSKSVIGKKVKSKSNRKYYLKNKDKIEEYKKKWTKNNITIICGKIYNKNTCTDDIKLIVENLIALRHLNQELKNET